MKKRLLAGMIVLSLTLAGCTTPVSKPTTTVAPTETTVAVAESTTMAETTTAPPETTEAPATLMDNFQALVTPESNAGDLGLFIRDHIGLATPEEAELMIQWLLIYQSEPILRINDVIYTEAYANPLYDVMGGIIDPEKIADIEDETVRSDYQALVDGFMTLVRYEETPSIETDWEALATLNDAFTIDMAELITLRSMDQFSYSVDYYQMAENIVMVEELINSADNAFLRSQLQKLHSNYVYDLLVGPEGMDMDTFVVKSDDVYRDLITFAGDFPDASFTQFLYELGSKEWENYLGPYNALSEYIAFGYGSDYHWITNNELTDQGEGEKILLTSDQHHDVTAKINDGIDAIIDNLATNTNGSYDYYTYASYSSDSYVSAYVSLHYLATPDQTKYLESAATFDLTTGNIITLSDYLGVSDDEAITIVNYTTGTDYTMLPNIQLMNDGIMLTPQLGETAEQKWNMMATKALIPYLSFEDLQRQLSKSRKDYCC